MNIEAKRRKIAGLRAKAARTDNEHEALAYTQKADALESRLPPDDDDGPLAGLDDSSWALEEGYLDGYMYTETDQPNWWSKVSDIVSNLTATWRTHP